MRINTALKTKVVSILITLVMVLGMLPMSALAADDTVIYVGGIGMADGDYLASGATEVSASAPATGGYAYYKDGVLTLNNYRYEGEGYMYDGDGWYTSVICSPAKLKIVLEGQSSITNTQDRSDGITVEEDLTISGEGKLTVNADYGIYGSNITIDGGSLHVIAYDDGFYAHDGDFTINGGVLNVIAYKGVEATGSVYFNGGVSTIDATHGYMTVTSDSGIYLKDGMKILQPEGVVTADDNGYYFEDAYGETSIRIAIGPTGTALPEIYVGGVGMADGTYLASGATATTTAKPVTGGYAYYNDGVLTLNNYVYEGEGYWYDTYYSSVIYSLVKLEIVLEGQSSLTNTSIESDGITAEAELTVSGNGRLDVAAEYGIFSWDGDITIDGGRLNIQGGYNGICAERDITINGGILNITADYGIISDAGSVIFNGGTTTVNAGEDGSAVTAAVDIELNEEDGVEILEPTGAEIGQYTYFDDDDYTAVYDSEGNPDIRVVIGVSGSAIAVEATSDGDSWGTVTGGDTYEKGSTATLTATPAEGMRFEYWLDTSVTLGDAPTEEDLKKAIVSDSATYSFTVTEDVSLKAVFSVPLEVPVTPMLITGTDKDSLAKAEELNYEIAPVIPGKAAITLPGEVIDKIITVGGKQYSFAGFIFYDDDKDTDVLKETYTIGAMPVYDSVEYWDWSVPISDGLRAAYVPYTPAPQNPDDPQDPDEPQEPGKPDTGDNSHIALWFALLFVSGGTLASLTVYDRKRRKAVTDK